MKKLLIIVLVGLVLLGAVDIAATLRTEALRAEFDRELKDYQIETNRRLLEMNNQLQSAFITLTTVTNATTELTAVINALPVEREQPSPIFR